MRGQTTLDFATGTAVFLLTLIFVFSFVPGVLQPFTDTQQAEPVVANRVADRLAEGALGSPSQPYALNRTCTVEFFDDNAPSGCNYQGTDLNDRVGLTERSAVNVTMYANVTGDRTQERICWDDSDEKLREVGGGSCGASADVDLTIGSTKPETSSSVTAQRVVYLDGTAVTLEVTTW